MNASVDRIALWLVDFQVAATLLLLAALAAMLFIRQPARRLAIGWAAMAGVGLLLFFCALPQWPRVSWLVVPATPRTAAADNAIERAGRLDQGKPAASDAGKAMEAFRSHGLAESPSQEDPALHAFSAHQAEEETVAPVGQRGWTLHGVTPWLVGLFAGGALLTALWLVLGAVQTLRLYRSSTEAPRAIRAQFERLTAPARRVPRLLVSPRLRGPIATGIIRPAVILPEPLAADASPEGLVLVLTHEWSHIRNGDLWLLAAGRVLLLAMFAHPLYWWLQRRIRQDQESVADAEVVARAGRTDYAKELLNWAQRLHGRPPVYAAALGIWERPSSLTRRIKMILDETRRIHARCSRKWRAGAMAAAGLLALATSLLTLQPTVSSARDETREKKPAESASEGLTYHGTVTDRATGEPIKGATVTVLRRVSNKSIPFTAWKKLGETRHQTDANGRYTFTVPPNQAAEHYLYIEITVTHPDYVRYYGGYSFAMIRKNEKLGERPFFERLRLGPAEKISGTVVTPDGKPAAGVVVKGFSTRSKKSTEHSSWADVKTDENGRFEFNASKGGEALFWIIPEDYAPSTHVVHSRRGDFGRFVLQKGLVLRGHVVDVDGKPVPNAWVNANIRGGPAKQQIDMPVADHLRRSAPTNQKGEFVLAPLPAGEYSITVTDNTRGSLGPTGEPLPAVFLNTTTTLAADEPTQPIEIRAVPHALVKGRFVDSSGKSTTGFAPHLTGRTDGPSPTFWFANTQIDKQGRFTAKAPKGLRIRLTLHDNEHHALRTRVAEGAPLTNDRDVDLGKLEEDAADITIVRYVAPILLVKAVDQKGKTIAGFQPKIKYLPGRYHEGEYVRDGRSAGDVNFERQTNGQWRTSQLLPDEEFVLTVEAPGYRSRFETMSVPEGVTKEVTWRLKKKSDGPESAVQLPGSGAPRRRLVPVDVPVRRDDTLPKRPESLKVVVLDKRDAPLADVPVVLRGPRSRLAHEADFEPVALATDKSGATPVVAMPPGTCYVYVESNSKDFDRNYTLLHNGQPGEVDPLVKIESSDGLVTVTFTVRKGAGLAFDVADAATGKKLTFATVHFRDGRVPGWTLLAWLDAGGQQDLTTIVEEMSDARYLAGSLGYYPQEFRLSKRLVAGRTMTERVELKPAPPIRFTVLDPRGKPAAGAAFKLVGPEKMSLGSVRDVEPTDSQGQTTAQYPGLGDLATYEITHASGRARVAIGDLPGPTTTEQAGSKTPVIDHKVTLSPSAT